MLVVQPLVPAIHTWSPSPCWSTRSTGLENTGWSDLKNCFCKSECDLSVPDRKQPWSRLSFADVSTLPAFRFNSQSSEGSISSLTESSLIWLTNCQSLKCLSTLPQCLSTMIETSLEFRLSKDSRWQLAKRPMLSRSRRRRVHTFSLQDYWETIGTRYMFHLPQLFPPQKEIDSS